jgi:hypothetical protein
MVLGVFSRLTADQLAFVAGIVIVQIYLRSARCESLATLSGQRVLEWWYLISWSTTH